MNCNRWIIARLVASVIPSLMISSAYAAASVAPCPSLVSRLRGLFSKEAKVETPAPHSVEMVIAPPVAKAEFKTPQIRYPVEDVRTIATDHSRGLVDLQPVRIFRPNKTDETYAAWKQLERKGLAARSLGRDGENLVTELQSFGGPTSIRKFKWNEITAANAVKDLEEIRKVLSETKRAFGYEIRPDGHVFLQTATPDGARYGQLADDIAYIKNQVGLNAKDSKAPKLLAARASGLRAAAITTRYGGGIGQNLKELSFYESRSIPARSAPRVLESTDFRELREIPEEVVKKEYQGKGFQGLYEGHLTDGTAVFGKIPRPQLVRENIRWSQVLSDAKLGPKFHGVREVNGSPILVYDFIVGDDIKFAEDLITNKSLSRQTLEDLRRARKFFADHHIEPKDFQFRINKKGRVYLTDPEFYGQAEKVDDLGRNEGLSFMIRMLERRFPDR